MFSPHDAIRDRFSCGIAVCQAHRISFSATQKGEEIKKQILVWRRTANTHTCLNPIGPSVTRRLHLKPQMHTHLDIFPQIELLMPFFAMAGAGTAVAIVSPSESLF